MLSPCHPQWFDIKLEWARQQPSFACRRDPDTLEYWLNGQVYLRVVRVGVRAELYENIGERVTSEAGYR